MKKQSIAIFFLAIFVACPCWAGNALLKKIDSIRLTDTEKAAALMEQVEISSLSEQERFFFEYLQAYFSTFSGDLAHTLNLYSDLLPNLAPGELKIRTLGSMLNIATSMSKWQQSFELGSILESELQGPYSLESKFNAYHNLAKAKLFAEQYSLAKYYVERMLDGVFDKASHRCIAYTTQNEFLDRIDEYPLDFESRANHAISECRAASQSFYEILNQHLLFRYYISNSQLNIADSLIVKIKHGIEQFGFVYADSAIRSAFAEYYLLKQDLPTAREQALKVIDADPNEQYAETLITAYTTLAEVAKREGNFEQAYQYLNKKTELRDSFHKQSVAKSLAIQQAKFNLAEKESELALMSERYKLAKAESELSVVQLRNNRLLLGLVCVLLAGLCLWSFRNRTVQQRLRVLATTDPLTGLYNRAHFTDIADGFLQSAKLNNQTVSLMLLDLDHFKRVNDDFGHKVGDWVLREVVRYLHELAPKSATLARMGGEEFAVLLRETCSDEAMKLAEVCRTAVETLETHMTGKKFNLSASFGVCDTNQTGYKLDTLLSAADLALHQSKKYGRNHVYQHAS
ncbi:GGDEF domain-containing protein [Alteromonas aestuariivivens]|uniref:GGDEF domain-containing protein n=1 Tax=Alteromonas aestuariivivens TaxID=1938339 RepID=UPI0011C02C67|nr:GGDEF domain-containing protein [Alteromonas aestuariivivens]